VVCDIARNNESQGFESALAQQVFDLILSDYKHSRVRRDCGV